jgi:putative ABC transport system permease protein
MWRSSLRHLLELAADSLLVHKLRSALSILGVVFGVAAVVAISSVAEGGRREALAQVGALGIDSITLRAQPGPEHERRAGLSLRDSAAVQAVVRDLVALAPVREASLPAEADGRRFDATVVGTTPGYGRAAQLEVVAGRFLAELDVDDHKRVAVLGSAVAASLFPFGNALAERVSLGGDSYQVVGVLQGRAPVRGKLGPVRARDVNQAVFIPFPSLDRGRDPRPDAVDEIAMRVDDASHVHRAAELARAVVQRTSTGAAFDVIIPREILRQKERTQRVFNVVTGSVAAISLIVGGIGIMNIMLAGVAERTSEVGIRRAHGATRRQIASQFLAESSLLTTVGGALGLVLGGGMSIVIQREAGWPTAIAPAMPLVALLSALAIGIGFGSYPAWKAAHLDPAEALRRE